ncbi:pentapeptide repeat-containing protein [Micromonospora echinospora]|uniref:pentapeptide repeat-containing protein n=1 Tax=Micromonospora echinospora TaxID=1877 RepID=UPI0036707119
MRVIGGAVVVVIVLVLLGTVVAAFGPLPLRVVGPEAERLNAADLVKAKAEARTALLQAVAGVLLVIGAVTAWRQMLISRSQHLVSRRVAVTDAFTKAVEHLGNTDSVAIRLGGVYSLDRIADDDPDERSRVADILAAFIRDVAVADVPLPRDAVAALTVLTRRDWPCGVDLAGAHLAGVRMPGARLVAARLSGTDMSGALVTGAVLREADLSGVDLRRADLSGADLRGARISGSRLSGATADAATCWPTGFDPTEHGVLVLGDSPAL